METSELFRRLKLNPSELDWKQLVGNPAPPEVAEASENKTASLSNAVAEAKRRLADTLGIASEKIEITIRL